MTNPAPGFYDDGHGVRRWWNGQAWTEHVEPGQVAVTAATGMQQSVLNSEVARYVAAGWSVDFNDGQQAVVSRPVRMSVVLNLLGVLLTGGLWLIYIVIRLASPRSERRTLRVDANGVVNGRL